MLVEFNAGDAPLVSIPRTPKEMISVTQEQGKTYVRINSSSLGVIQECGRKSLFSLEQGWKSNDESPATVFGTAIHKAMEVYYSGPIEGRKLVKLETLEMIGFGHPVETETLITQAVSAFVRAAQPLSPLPSTDKRSIQNGIWILSEYFKQFIDDPYVAYTDEKGPFVERQFTHRIFSDDSLVIDIFGTIDFAFRNIHTGEIIIGDHKTTSSLGWGGSSYYDRDKPNHQYTMYALGAREVFAIQTEDFLVNVIEVKAKPKTKGAKGVSFPRQITKRTQEDFEETIEAIRWSVNDYLQMREQDIWPMGGVDACNKYGGCTYKQICATPKSMRETILNNKFIREKQ